jgi:uncharacterized protein (TIGR02466 family)
MKLEIVPLFSVPFATASLPQSQSLCAELSTLFLAREAEGARYRNRIARDTQHGLFESHFDLHTWPEAPVQQAFGFIHHTLAALLQQLSGFSPEVYATLGFDYHSWFHVTRPGGHQGVHNHPMASWSGIFCVDPGDSPPDRPESGAVRFLDTRVGAEMYLDAGNEHMRGQFRQGSYQYRHEAGRLVLFPSYVYHEVFPYWGTRPRIVIAFNAWIRTSTPTAAG